jgi:tetratricopeptide (TPR) repeat protein
MTDSHVIASSRRFASTRARAGRWILAVTMTGAALALGSLHTQVLCVVAVALAVAVGLLWWGAEPMRLRPSAKILLGVCAGLTAYTALQAVPMPAAWLAVIAPKNADVWARCLSPLHEAGPAWVTVSLDPIATRVEVLRGVVYGLALVGGLRVAVRREGALFLERAIVGAGVVMVVATIAHPALGFHKVFGVYEPRDDWGIEHVAPLLNPNHLAGFLNIAVCVGLASALSASPMMPRVILGALVALMAAMQFWVASRGGILSLLLGAVLVVVMTRAAPRAATQWRTSGLVAGFSVAAAMALVFLAASNTASRELSDTSVSKVLFIKAAFVRMVPAYAWLGAGRGAFESSFAEFGWGLVFGTMTHPENFIVEWLSGWGVPVTMAALGFTAYALRPRVAFTRSTPAIGPWCALMAVGTQNMVDFSSEVPGVVLPLVLCAAVVVGGRSVEERSKEPRVSLRGFARQAPLGAAAVVLAALAWVSPGLSHELTRDRASIYASSRPPRLAGAELGADIKEAMARHPAEPYFPYAGALFAARAPGENVLPWIERTLERAPVYPPAHFLLARWLRRRSPSQARLEYRIASEQEPPSTATYAQEGASLVSSTDDALELLPDGAAALAALDTLASRLRLRLPATSVALDRELLARQPDAKGPLVRRAEDDLLDLGMGDAAPWCASQRDACSAGALRAAKDVSRLFPTLCEGHVLEARVRLAAGDAAGGLDELRNATDAVDDRVECLRQLANLGLQARDETRTTEALDRLAHAGCAAETECVQNLLTAAQIEEQRGNRSRALLLYEKAGERSPDRDDLLELVAAHASGAGMHALALDSYRKLSERHPGERRYRDAIQTEERAAMAQAVH